MKNCFNQELLPKSVTNKIPALYLQESKGNKAIVYVKYFVAGWTWLATEYNPIDGTMFGMVFSPMTPDGELGYFNINELAKIKVKGIFPVERDINWKPMTLEDCKNPCSV